MTVKSAPYGSWESPITSASIVKETVGLSQVKVDGTDRYWIEMRPSEEGRSVIVRSGADGVPADVTPPGFNARTRVHEYGGGDYLIHQGTVYFSNFADQRLYRQSPGGMPEPVTPENRYAEVMAKTHFRYADAVADSNRRRLVCVREDHSDPDHEAVNALVAIAMDAVDDPGQVLVSGNDFYSSPQISPNGSRLAWLTWNHPNMPWDESELWVADLEAGGSLVNARRVAGGNDESIFQPQWSPAGNLFFVSDRTGWWNIYQEASDGSVALVLAKEAEFGAPQWGFGMSTYAFADHHTIVCTYAERGIWRLGLVDINKGVMAAIDTPYNDISFLRATNGRAVFRGGSPTQVASIVELDLSTRLTSVLRLSNNLKIDSRYLSVPQPVEFPTTADQTAHAFFYPARNGDYAAPQNELPLLLVKSHGGPTSAAVTTLSLNLQYWTSRGIAVLDVNYGGSSGFGREYRRRLRGQWGIVDVDDCVNGARYLVANAAVDSNRLMIDGGSAGGYTTLCALTFRDTFKAGASHYGVSDAEALAKETHKFESRYLDGLIGPYPERADLYRERSPVNFTEQLSCPVIFFQGLEDKVVPPNQAEMMVAALREKGIPVAYVAFPGEQHGFRRAANIRRAQDGELYFYARVFGFVTAEMLEPVEIYNLDAAPKL
jgi:dipeptidyl aminopeptidase/acylaminoacyl peptidase